VLSDTIVWHWTKQHRPPPRSMSFELGPGATAIIVVHNLASGMYGDYTLRSSRLTQITRPSSMTAQSPMCNLLRMAPCSTAVGAPR
jgi:hypothetical protein